MPDLPFPLLSAAIAVPLAAAAAAWRSSGSARAIGMAGAGLAGLLSAAAAVWVVSAPGPLADPLLPFLFADGLSIVPMAAFAALVLCVLAAGSRHDVSALPVACLLVMLAGTLAAYASGNLIVLLIAWVAAGVPMLVRNSPLAARIAHASGSLALAAGLILLGLDRSAAGVTAPWSLVPSPAELPHDGIAFGLLLAAVVLRMGLFPAHFWVIATADRMPLPTAGLLLNGHLGAFLLARVVIPLLPGAAQESLPEFSILAMFTSMFASVASLAERRPRRALMLIGLSQASFVVTGLCSRTAEGAVGALVHWLVVAAAFTGIASAFRAAEARCEAAAHPDRFLGLAAHAPRLAVSFLVCGLALVGLPGTLGFPGEDLLFHGALLAQPLLGVALPLATALNAIQLLRVFSMLFLGCPQREAPAVRDVLRRERLALIACVLFLVAGGVFPQAIVNLRAPAAHAIALALGTGPE